MLNEFWEKNKWILGITALFAALCGIFLTINPPESLNSRGALINLQSIFLVLLSLSVLLLSWRVFKLARSLEETVRQKWVDVSFTLSISVVSIALFIIYYLWKYLIYLYPGSLISLTQTLSFSVGMLMLALFSKLFMRLNESLRLNMPLRSVLVLSTVAIFCFVFGSCIEYFLHGLAFSMYTTLWYSLIFLILLITGVILFGVTQENDSKNKNNV